MSEDYGALPQPDYTYRGLRYSKPATTVRVYDEKLGRYRAATPEETARTLAAGNDAAPSPKSEANPLRLPFEEEEGYHRSAFLPLRIRTDTGESELATPGFIADPLRAALKIGAAFKGDLPPEEVTYKDIIDATGAVGGGGIALSSGRVPQGSLGMFVGPRAQLPEAQAAYRQMRNTPAPDVSDAELLKYLPAKVSPSPSAIVGQDRAGRLVKYGEAEDITPRFLISDEPMRIRESAFVDPNPMIVALEGVTVPPGHKALQGTLKEAIDHPELFKAYPSLENVELIQTGKLGGGSYLRDQDRIGVGYSDLSDLRETVLHEIQHAIQKREGFVGGANFSAVPQSYTDAQNTYFSTLRDALKQAKGSESIPDSEVVAAHNFLRDYRRAVKGLEPVDAAGKQALLEAAQNQFQVSRSQLADLFRKYNDYAREHNRHHYQYYANPGEMEARVTQALRDVPESELALAAKYMPRVYGDIYGSWIRGGVDPEYLQGFQEFMQSGSKFAKGGEVMRGLEAVQRGYAEGGSVDSQGLRSVLEDALQKQGTARPNYMYDTVQVEGPRINAPMAWQSAPGHPPTMLAYITPEEASLLSKMDIHNSGVDKERHYGPLGIPSFNGGGGSAGEGSGADSGGSGDFGSPSERESPGFVNDIDTGYLEGVQVAPERSLMDMALGYAYERAMNAIENPVTTAINFATSFTPLGPVNALSNVLGGPTVGSALTAAGRGVGEALGIGTPTSMASAPAMAAPSTASYSTGGDSRDIGVPSGVPQEPTVAEVAPTLAPSYISSKVQPRSPSAIYGSLGMERPGTMQGNPFTAYAYAEGGYVPGKSGGMDDDVPAIIDGKQPARLSSGEFVFDAATVAALGDGNNAAGARKLDGLRKAIRKKAYGHEKQPPKNYSVGDLVRIYDRRS